MFSTIDWLIFFAYFLTLGVSSFLLSKTKLSNSREFFLSKNSMGMLSVAISILATSQSAATFLGAPEYAYAKDFTFIGFYISALLAVVFVAVVFVPRFYEMRAVTVYELLELRYGVMAKKYAGVMFLLGRVLASGARLYIGALAISMILFFDIEFLHVAISIFILIFGALAYAYFGGVRSIILSDIIQAVTYIGAGVAVLIFLYYSLDGVDILSVLQENNKLNFIDYSLDGKFGIFALLSGWFLLNVAAFGLDQDMTQRVLTCKDKNDATKSLILSIVLTIPVVLLFLSIGALLFVYYQQADVVQNFDGEKITIFMYYILHEMPEGLRALVTVGAIAAALSSTNSVLGAMASVAVEDIYRPYKEKRVQLSEKHYLKASRMAVVFFALLLSAMAMVSYFWQHYLQSSLLSFALGVMVFAYAGLLGVYFSAIFTKRGSERGVLFALIGGFLTVLFLQPYMFDIKIGFSYQLLVGTIVSFLIMQTTSSKN
jgi:SSS family transporter